RPHLGWTCALSSCRLSSATGFLRGNCFWLSFLQLFDDSSGAGRVDSNPRSHRARKRNGTNVAPLRGGRLRAHDLVDQHRVVLGELTLVEALLADRDVDVR